MADDDGDDVKRIMQEVLDTPVTADWSVTGPSIRRSARSRWTRYVPSSSLVAAAAIIVALATSLVLISTDGGGSHHRAALPAGSRGAGNAPGTTVPTPTSAPSATSVPSSNTPTTVPRGSSSTTLPVTTTTGAPVVGPKSLPGSCMPTPSPIAVSSASATACVAVGSVVTVTFTQLAAYGGPPGGWLGGATSSDPTIVVVDSSTTSGPLLTAQIRGLSPGTATVMVDFQNECSAATTTPCTIPPQGQETLTVQVTN